MKRKFDCEVDCANCAQKMEDAINKLDGVKSATVSFLQQRLTLECDDDRFEEILDQVVKTCKRVEPDCEIKR